jgi:UDP-N-acetylglucosamine--N-acetylmuramyl-(pentapeptide) pyrophosphoryl-undecaprenol N-acetylglucosamine transferase
VAEAAMAGLPAIFVPLKHGDMQQKHNALSVTGRGGGWIMMQEDFTPEALAQKLRELLENPAILATTAAAAKACARPDAVQKLADVVEQRILK